MDGYDFKKLLNSTISNQDDFLLCIEGNRLNPLPPKHRFDWLSASIRTKLNRALYVVKFFQTKDVFIIWDAKRRRDIGGVGGYTFDLGVDWDTRIIGPDVFWSHYRELGRHNSGIYEKIYVVGLSNFDLFFQNCDTYMQFNALDDEFPHNSQRAIEEERSVHWKTKSERKKYSSSQYKRDKQFRADVLAVYGHRCAICRCNISEVLQAAHEAGYDVAHTNYDDPNHGICLCANHHLMYDNNLLKIDLDQLTIEILEEKVKNMSWYQDFIEKYDGKIIKRGI